LASSIAFWWYCNNGVTNILVGISLFEVFHDVQYLSIVWIYNRTRVERDESIGGFMRFVFRRSGSLVGVYVGLVLMYGSIALLSSGASADWIRHALIGLVTASALLHFYYDGFIWKVRETQTGSVLGIASSAATAAARQRRLPTWLPHGVRWATLIIPFSALCAAQLFGRAVPPLERTAKVVEVLPDDAEAQLKLGQALHEQGRVQEAISHYTASAKLKPNKTETQWSLGLAYSDIRDFEASAAYYQRALELDPKNAKTEFNYASVLAVLGKTQEARERYEHSLTIDPKQFLAHKELGDLLFASGDPDGAIAHYNQSLALKPDFAEAQQHLDYVRKAVRR
ncbi:MAG: tetratricopeptide repeat protein, partial [Chthoniobacterales bacterium]